MAIPFSSKLLCILVMNVMKKAQISTEVMYSVGVMIMIFLILTGISFNRRVEIKKLDDFYEKRNECLKLANFLTSIGSFGQFSSANGSFISGGIEINLKHYADVFDYGVIVVRDPSESIKTVEATCTFNANVISTLNLMPGSYLIQHFNNTIKIKTPGGFKYQTPIPY